MYKLIVSDLDGTLLGSQHEFSNMTIETVNKLTSQGYIFAIATGRHFLDVKALAKKFQHVDFLITSNGAMIHDKEGQEIFRENLESHTVKEILKMSEGFAGHRNIYQNDRWLVEEPHERLLKFHKDSGFHYQMTDFSSADYSDTTKVFFISSHKSLKLLEKPMLDRFGDTLNITFSMEDCLEMMKGGVSKGHALRHILDKIGLEPCQTVVFGDGMNDLEILNMAGLPVVMENASEELQSSLIKFERASPCDSDGVARFLIERILR